MLADQPLSFTADVLIFFFFRHLTGIGAQSTLGQDIFA